MNPIRLLRVLALLTLSALTPAHPGSPVLRTVKAGGPGVSLLRNGDFEMPAGKASGWHGYGAGFRLKPGEGREGGSALFASPAPDKSEEGAGAAQTLVLNRTRPAPLVIRGWSKAENVSGSPDSNYSLYVDLVYADGTPMWGQTANFRCGSHDWELRERIILPDRPVKSLTVYCMLRGRTGTAWFDDVSVEELAVEGDALLYQGAPMQLLPPGPVPPAPEQTFATRDGLRLALRGSAVASLQVDGRELAQAPGAGFLARDVAANSDIFPFRGGECPELGLRLRTQFDARPGHVAVSGRITDVSGKDRAVTLLFALPIDATGWSWGNDIRHSQPVQGRGEFSGTVGVHSGATGTQSVYPLAAVWDGRSGVALGLDMAQPAQYRLGYHAGAKHLFIAYDFGLVPETERFPSAADFRFVLYRFDPAWGFRAAFERYAGIFPDHFAVRSRDQGMWMPFTDVSEVQGWEDFGFRYHEGNNNVPWDDAHGILSFRYTEPMTWWMPMKPDVARTPGEALRVRDELAAGRHPQSRRMAELSRSAAMHDDAGQPALLFRDTPWCNGAVWSLNPNPHLPGAFNFATLHWNEAVKEKLYGASAKGRLDGEYLDSLEGYVTADLNFRREHFRHTTVPLTFAPDTKQPALGKGLAVHEFTRWISDDVHRLGGLMFANGIPYRFTFLAPWLDVLGTETNWLRKGKYQPAAEPTMNLWRTMSGAKPYLLLMNTDYDALTPDLVEKYFQRTLFFGMFPGMFSHNAAENPYWKNPAWYNRDRHLFRKYQPLIKRIAEAGWRPVTGARSDNPAILVERFGPDADGALYFTLFNDTETTQDGRVSFDAELFKSGAGTPAQELIGNRPLALDSGRISVSLAPQSAWLVRRK